MRAALAVLVLLLAAAPPAAARDYEGTILVGQPFTNSAIHSITENLAPCDPGSTFNGVDSYWIDVAGETGRAVTLTMDPTLDADAYFWDDSCEVIPMFACAVNFLDTPERCTMPEGTRWVSVAGFTGTGGFLLRIE